MSTSILDEIQDYRERKMMAAKITVADTHFLDNIDNIKKISRTGGYIMIKDYWTREFNASLDRVQSVNPALIGEVAKAQASLELSKKFLTFLSAYENPITPPVKSK